MEAIDLVEFSLSALRWNLLDRPTDKENGLSTRLASAQYSKDLYIAVDSEGRRYLLLQLPPQQTQYVAERPSRGLAIRTVEMRLDNEGNLGVFVEIGCIEKTGEAALDIIALELLAALSMKSSHQPIIILRRVLVKWRKFWGEAKNEILSRQQQIGLFGELWYLAYWLIPMLGSKLAISMWRGPVGAKNDFESSEFVVEVKTSSKTDGGHIVNGLEQLVAFGDVNLFVFSLIIREEASSNHSLTEIIRVVRKLINDDEITSEQFESMLAASGYEDSESFEYDRSKFRIRSECLYKVTDGFPRIVPSDLKSGLPLGVSNLSYEIRLDGAGHWLIADRPEKWVTLGI